MLTVATYFWGSKYDPADVYRLRDGVAKYLTVPHEFVVVTDRPRLFDDIRAIPLDTTTHVPGTCFVRLMTFHPAIIGEWVLQIDLDTLIVGDMNPLVERDEDLVLWRNPSRIPWDKPLKPGRPYYNTSILLHRCGTMSGVWASFDSKNPGCRDDQWWLSDFLGPDVPYWDGSDGIYRLGRADTPGSGVSGILPENARVVTFPGSEGKWSDAKIRAANPWIKDFLAA